MIGGKRKLEIFRSVSEWNKWDIKLLKEKKFDDPM
jgi:hypothetical protein